MSQNRIDSQKMSIEEAKDTLAHLEKCSLEQKCFIKGVIEGMKFQAVSPANHTLDHSPA